LCQFEIQEIRTYVTEKTTAEFEIMYQDDNELLFFQKKNRLYYKSFYPRYKVQMSVVQSIQVIGAH